MEKMNEITSFDRRVEERFGSINDDASFFKLSELFMEAFWDYDENHESKNLEIEAKKTIEFNIHEHLSESDRNFLRKKGIWICKCQNCLTETGENNGNK